jgi:hypothetical protein
LPSFRTKVGQENEGIEQNPDYLGALAEARFGGPDRGAGRQSSAQAIHADGARGRSLPGYSFGRLPQLVRNALSLKMPA